MYVKQLFNEESKDLPKLTLFWFTLSLSIISSSLGIIRFLMHGPCRLLPNYTLFGGYATIGFSILLINVITALIGKFLLAIGMIYSIFYGNYGQYEQLFLDGNEKGNLSLAVYIVYGFSAFYVSCLVKMSKI